MNAIAIVFLIILLSGAVGGFVFAVLYPSSHRIKLPFSIRTLEIGFLGDALIGAAASIAVYLIAREMFKFDLAALSRFQLQSLIQAIGLGVISGFAGRNVLFRLSGMLFEKLSLAEERLKRNEKLDACLRRARFLLDKNPDKALVFYDSVLAEDADHPDALIGKAKIYRRKRQYEEAIRLLTRVIEKNPDYERAYYNRACYRNNSTKGSQSRGEVLDDLRHAVRLYPDYKWYARDDKDFKNLWEDEDFKKITRE